MHSLRTRLICAAATLLAAAVIATPADAAPPPPANPNAAFLEVFTDNVENLPETDHVNCKGDWQDLYYYMRQWRQYAPDVFIVQQVTDQAQLQRIADKMQEVLGQVYRARIIAVESPVRQGSDCDNKHYQTSGIIYRDGRLRYDPAGNPTTDLRKIWQSQHQENGTGPCVNNDQSRTVAVAARLWDKLAGKYVDVASIHWPTKDQGGNVACAASNEAEVRNELNESGWAASLKIWGGDANTHDRKIPADSAQPWNDWYRSMNGDLGVSGSYFRDVIFDYCLKTSPTLDLRPCLNANHTLAGSSLRYDYLMASRQSSTRPRIDGWVTVQPGQAGDADKAVTGSDNAEYGYSDHLAVGARIYY